MCTETAFQDSGNNSNMRYISSSSKKTTQFAPLVRIYVIPRPSRKQRKKLWFSSQEMEAIWTECLVTIQCMKHENLKWLFEGENARCESRGLERHTAPGRKRTSDVRDASKAAVMGEQGRQQFLGIHDGDAIASAYQGAAADAIQLAQKLGNCDHWEAQQGDEPFGIPPRRENMLTYSR